MQINEVYPSYSGRNEMCFAHVSSKRVEEKPNA
jgi:hypothetical protein